MSDELVRTHDPEKGVAILTILDAPDIWFDLEAKQQLYEQLLAAYQAVRKDKKLTKKSCVVQIAAQLGGTSIVRALLELSDAVIEDGGWVVCVGFPEETLDALTASGVASQKEFILAGNIQQARALLDRLP